MIVPVAYEPYQPTTDFGHALWSAPNGIVELFKQFLMLIGWLFTLTPASWSDGERILVFPAAYIALYAAFWPVRWLRRRKPKAKLGKAQLANLFHVLRDGLLWPGGRFLGQFRMFFGLWRFDLSMRGEGHCLAIAPPGSGKTTGCVIPTLLTYKRGSVIVTDPKGEITAQTKRFRSRLGRVVVLSPWRDELVNDPSFGIDLGDDGFNPCQLVGADEEGRSAAAQLAALILPGDNRQSGENYFYLDGRELLEWGLLFLAMVTPDKLTLPGLRNFLYAQVSMVGALKAVVASDRQGLGWDALREGASKLLSIAQTAPPQWAGVIGTATTALKIYNADTKLGQHSVRNGFRLSDLNGPEKVTVFIVCPPGHLVGDDRRWLNLVLALIMQQVGKPGMARETVMLVDEFPALGFVPSLMPSLEQFRGAGLRAHLYAQSPGQIVNIYGQDGLSRLWGVCDTKQFFRFTDHAQAHAVSDWMGHVTVDAVSVNERGDRTMSAIGVPLVRPEELTQMKKDRQIIFRPGIPPIRARVYPYFKRASWRALVDPNPYRVKKRRPAAALARAGRREEGRP